MVRQAAASQASRFLARATIRSPSLGRTSLLRLAPRTAAPRLATAAVSHRTFSSCPSLRKGIMPDTDNPGKEVPPTPQTYGVVELSEAEYHEVADKYLESVLNKFEQLQDSREDVDVEYSSGVMTITIPPKGTYVINKQPPNKQIWLSSPISGPKRYDWCIVGEGQGEKEGTGEGAWIYARDGTSLNELVLKELDIDLGGQGGA